MATRFQWPPRPAPDAAPAAPALGTPSLREGPSPPSFLRSIERTWLGLTTPPLAERIAQAGWAPDEPHLYCPRCGHNVGPHEADDTGCSRCRAKRFPWDRLIRLGEYSGLLRECVQEVKFTRWRRLGHELGLLLGRSLAAAIDNAGLPRHRCILVPIPCSFRRRLARGIDHTLVLTRGVRAATGLPILRALTRSHRPTQLSLPASQRPANVANSIHIRRGISLAGLHVILIDDVTTTRATLLAAARGLQATRKALTDNKIECPASLWTAVVAVTPIAGSPPQPA